MFGRSAARRNANVNYAREWAKLEAFWESHSDALNLSALQQLARREGTVRLVADRPGTGASHLPRLVDEARGIQFQSDGARGRSGTRAWILTIENSAVPIFSEGPLDLVRGDNGFALSLDLQIGPLPVSPLWSAQQTRPAETADRLHLIAIECLIEYGLLGDGSTAPDGRWRVLHDGRLFWRADGALWSTVPPQRANRGLALADEWLHLDWS